MKNTVNAKEFRAAMTALGYQVRIATNAEFKSATVMRNGAKINGGNVLTQEHLDKHAAFYAWKNTHKVVDGDWIVTF